MGTLVVYQFLVHVEALAADVLKPFILAEVDLLRIIKLREDPPDYQVSPISFLAFNPY
jgi:hypothetical protein